jgi:WhiB family redox-sensing transcriptional regulator
VTVMPTISDLLDAGIPGTLLPDSEALPEAAAARWSIPCHESDPEVWFADTPAGVEHAKALCGSCPLKVECLAGALDRAEPWGVWGGELFEQGVVVPRKRPRGRPRKSEVA